MPPRRRASWALEVLYRRSSRPLATANFSVIPVEQLLQQRETTPSSRSRLQSRDLHLRAGLLYVCQEHGAEDAWWVTGNGTSTQYSFDVERIAAERAVGFVLRQHEAASRRCHHGHRRPSRTRPPGGDLVEQQRPRRPVDDVYRRAQQSVRTQIGLARPTAVVMDLNLAVIGTCKTSDQILDRIKYSGGNADPANVSSTSWPLPPIFGVDKVIIAGRCLEEHRGARPGRPPSRRDL